MEKRLEMNIRFDAIYWGIPGFSSNVTYYPCELATTKGRIIVHSKESAENIIRNLEVVNIFPVTQLKYKDKKNSQRV